MVYFSDRRAVARWITARPDARETAVTLAARVALRVLPLIIHDYAYKSSTTNRSSPEYLFRMFRAADVAWFIARYPSHRQKLRPAAANARPHSHGVASAAISFAVAAADDAAGAAGFAAAAAAADDASGAIESARSAFATGGDSRLPKTKHFDFAEVLKVADGALVADMDLLDAGLSPQELAGRPLWIGQISRDVKRLQRNLETKIPKTNDWDVWKGWYQQRLQGDFSNEDAELNRVRISGQYPGRSIKYLNAKIKKIVEESELSTDWARKLASLKQESHGAKFVQRGDQLAIDATGNNSDVSAAADPLTCQMHDGVKRRAVEFADIAKRVDNQIGWSGLGVAAIRFSEAVNCDTDEIPSRIGRVYDNIIALGSFLDMDSRLRSAPDQNAVDPLALDVHRVLVDLIRSAAPWVRRFPTARTLDDEAGAFLRPALYEPANTVVCMAQAANLISPDDAQLLQALADAARRGEFQGQKAGSRSIWSSKNLITAVGMILSFEMGMVGNEAAPKSVIAQKGAKFYLSAEDQVMKLFEDASPDVVHALKALVNELRESSHRDLPVLPYPLREAFSVGNRKKREPEDI